MVHGGWKRKRELLEETDVDNNNSTNIQDFQIQDDDELFFWWGERNLF
jgi:hypothetical protein